MGQVDHLEAGGHSAIGGVMQSGFRSILETAQSIQYFMFASPTGDIIGVYLVLIYFTPYKSNLG